MRAPPRVPPASLQSPRHRAVCLSLAAAVLCPWPAWAHREGSDAQAYLVPSAGDGTAGGARAGKLRSGSGLRLGQAARTQVLSLADCQGHGTFLEVLSSQSSGLREQIWSLLHHEMMAPETAVSLLDHEEKRAAEEVRAEAATWVASVKARCAAPAVCQVLANTLLSTDEPTCSTLYVLSQAQAQLDASWARDVVRRERISGRHANLTGKVLALQRWGLRLLHPTPASPSAGSAVVASLAAVASSEYQADRHASALGLLDVLVQSLAEPDADLLHLVRQFLKLAEKVRGRSYFTATGSPDSLLSLLRLLHEQRSQATASSLVHDAVLVDFHEARVRELEGDWATFDAECAPKGGCTGAVGEWSLPVGGKEGSPVHGEMHGLGGEAARGRTAESRLARLQAGADGLSRLLSRLAADHAALLPTDGGALPAYWGGRVERVKRRLEGYTRDGGFRPTVLIWTCSFGGGHWAATRAVQGYLPDYRTIVTDPTRDHEYYEDDTVGNWIRRFIQPDWDETYLFNQFVLRNKVYELESTVENLQAFRGWLRGDGTHFARPCAAPTCDNEDKKLMRRALLRSSPDFVITVYHMDLLPITELCDELGGLPIMHLSTDADVKMRQVFGERPAYPNLRVGLPFDVPEVWPTIKPLTRNQTFVSGYSVRMAFLRALPTPDERRAERLRRQIPEDATVLLVMSGSEGQAVDWPTRLADSETWDQPLHVIVVAAHNRDFGARLEGELLPLPSSAGATPRFRGSNGNVTVQVARDPRGGLGGMQHIYYLCEDEVSSLMDLADVLITKPGGSTVAEAAYRGIPIVFDATGGVLSWEEFNAKVFELHKRGVRMTSVADLEHTIRRAAGLGRSRSLVSDSLSGGAIDARRQIRQEMQRMLEAFAVRRQQL